MLPDVTDAPNSIPGVCLSVRPSLRWSLTLSKILQYMPLTTYKHHDCIQIQQSVTIFPLRHDAEATKKVSMRELARTRRFNFKLHYF